MPRILKAGSVSIDKDNVVNIEISPSDNFKFIDPESDTYVNVVDDRKDESEAEAIISRARREADDIRKDAEAKAKTIVSDAKKQAAQIIDNARRDGHEQGYAEGCAEAQALKDEALQIYNETVASCDQAVQDLEPEMVALIIDLVDKLIHTAADINPAVIVNLIKQGLAGATLTGDVVIHVSEEDYDDAASQKQALLSMVDASSKIEILKDFSLNKSDCVIETPFGNIDSSLDQQYEALKRDLSFILSGDLK